MKKIFMFLLICLFLQTAALADGKAEPSLFENDTYTVSGVISVDNDQMKLDVTELDFEIPADKIVVLAYNKGYEKSPNYSTTYLGLRDENGENCQNWTGGDSEPSRMRYFKTTKKQHGRFTVVAGLQKKTAGVSVPPFEWKYELSVKIFDSPDFVPRDALGGISGDKNFFISSGPEGIFETNLYTKSYRQYLCRAPINGNANIYWSHMDKTGKNAYFGVLLTNTDSKDIEIKINSLNYLNADLEEYAWSSIYHEIFVKHGKLSAGYAGGHGGGEKITLSPGESKWLCTYRMNCAIAGETTGISSVSIDGGNYTGYGLICTTYAFADKALSDFIPQNFADWEVEAAAEATSMRGSGDGAILQMKGKFSVPFQTILAGENMLSSGERILLTRLENGKYFTLDNKNNMRRIECGPGGTLPQLTDAETAQLNTYNCNFGTVYKLDLKNIVEDKGLKDGKRVVGKIKLSSRSTPSLAAAAETYLTGVGLNVAVWRTKNGVLDFADGETLILQTASGIDPKADNIVTKADEGVYMTFDENVPLYDKDNDYSYYFVGSGMSFFPFEISLEYEDIELENEPFPVYIDGDKVDFADVRPQITDGRTYVPIRAIFEAMGADLYYEDGVAAVFFGDRVLEITIGSDTLVLFDTEEKVRREIKTDGIPRIEDGRTLVPLRAISESMGFRVDFDSETTAIFIYR
ncbi:MAG: copper amine oxidase N-terminal domain-containing protein [Clostridia bacterium]|nr:copper amine oxidase N-terminal domain-containing protein [Clostridia bacterium]